MAEIKVGLNGSESVESDVISSDVSVSSDVGVVDL